MLLIRRFTMARIKAVENLNGLISTANADILLTAAGYRPSTFIYLESLVYSTNDAVK